MKKSYLYIILISMMLISAIFPREVVVCSPFIVLLCFFDNLDKIYRVLSPIKFMILGLFYWGGVKSIGLYLSPENIINQTGLYLYLLTLFGVIVLLLYVNRLTLFNNIILINNQEINFNKIHYFILLIIWIYISITLSSSLSIDFEDRESAFIVNHILQGPYLLIGGGLFLIGIKSENTFSLKKLASFIIPLIALLTISAGPLNRTTFILPVIFFGILIVMGSKNILKMDIKSAGNLCYILIIIIIAIFSDIQRKTGLSIYDLISSADFFQVDYFSIIENSTFLPSHIDAEQYFSSIESIYENNLFRVFGVFNQLFSIITPRIFFPDKEQTDLSMILWDQGFMPQPAYYEIFLEPFIDSGPLGNLAFYAFLISIGYFCYWMLKQSINSPFQPFYLSLYALLLVSFFMVVRGPIIFLAWYLIPSIALMFTMLILKILRRLF